MITSPGRIRICLKLKRVGARKEQAAGDGTTKVAADTKKVSIVELCGSRNELTQNMNNMENVRTSNPKVNTTPNKVMIATGIIKGSTISRPQVNTKLHRCINSALIGESITREKILNVLLLGKIDAIRRRRDLETK